jgi:UDP-N-acetyl-D-mannosaminuronic acid dehydrogenase
VDDLRESPSLEIVRALHQQGVGEVMACDPYVSADQFREFPLHDLASVLDQSHILVLLTDHRHFRKIPRRILQEKVLVDTRGIWR